MKELKPMPKQSITRTCFWTMIPGCMSVLKSSVTNINKEKAEKEDIPA